MWVGIIPIVTMIMLHVSTEQMFWRKQLKTTKGERMRELKNTCKRTRPKPVSRKGNLCSILGSRSMVIAGIKHPRKKRKTEKEIYRILSHITYKRCCPPNRVLFSSRLPTRRHGRQLAELCGMRVHDASPLRIARKGCE